MVGIKLWVALRANNPELDPIIERATELKAVVFQHTWLKITGNLAGVPGISVPCGRTRSGLPIGLQVLGRHFDEATILRVAQAVEDSTAKAR